MDDDPDLGLWVDLTFYNISNGFTVANHPAFLYDPGNPNQFGSRPLDDHRIGRNLPKLGGDVHWSQFKGFRMKLRRQMASAGGYLAYWSQPSR